MRRLLVCLSAFATLAVVGCSRDDGPPPITGDGTLPPGTVFSFDLYLGDRLDLIDYARRKVEAECMAEAGYPQHQSAGVPMMHGNAQQLALNVGRAFGFASEEEARERGLGRSFGAEPARIVSFDANFDAVFERCRGESAEVFGTGAGQLLDQYSSIGNVLSSEFAVWARPRFEADFSALVDCLVASGYTVVDRQRFIETRAPEAFGLPSGHLEHVAELDWEPTRVPGTVVVGPPIPARRYVPSPQESELAVAWYRCDQESGRVEKFLADARTQRATIIAKYEGVLAEMNPQIEAIAQEAAALVQ